MCRINDIGEWKALSPIALGILPFLAVIVWPALAVASRKGAKLAPLMQAAADGDLSKVNELLKQENVNAQDNSGGTALLYAVRNRRRQIVRTLVAAGANPHLATSNGTSAVSLASRLAYIDVLEDLQTRIHPGDTRTP